MTALEAYALAKKIAISAVSGIANLSVNGTTLTIETNDGNTLDMVFPTPADGRGITKAEVNSNDHLIITYDDGVEEDAGLIKGSDVQVTQLLNHGIKIAKIKSGNITTDIFAPEGGSGGGNFFVIDKIEELPEDLTEDDRQVNFCIEDSNFYLWDGIKWSIISAKIKIRELTEEEYNALTTEEQMNGTIYFVTDEAGGGGGGTTNYNSLTNKPKINDEELTGNKTAAQLGLQSLLNWDNTPTSDSSNAVRSSGIFNALAEKVTAEAGKGLSSNDFTNALLTKLNGIEASADVNVIEKVLVNGTEVVPVNKEVALTVMTNTVNNLANYYLKSETYTQSEVDELISHISGGITLEVVETLPTSGISTTTIYLLATGENVYTQYLWSTKDNTWKILGGTTVDLSNYYTKAQMDALLAAKQDVLTFDSAPTSLSENPVTSGGVYSALAGKQDTLTFDNAPTENSANPVKSGGVYTALGGKQDTLTFDTEPTAGSTNPVTSGGVATALQNVDVPVATEEKAGKVKPDGTTVTVDSDGTIHAQSSVEAPVMQGATIYADGKSGSAPKPFIDDRNKALFGDGHYHEIYSASQGSTVIVKVDDSAVSCKGRTCTLTDGHTTLTATIDATSGEAVFSNVQLFGGVTVTATDADNNEAYGIGNVTYFGQYIIMLSMDVAVINLTTTDSDLFGQTLEVYKNGEQIGSSAFNILGQARIIVNEVAEYVMKASVGSRFAKKTVVVDLLGKIYTDTIELTTLFAVHYSESNSNPDSCDYPAGYSNSEFTDPFYVDLSTGQPHWGDWASPLAKFLIPKSCMLKTDGTVDYYLDEDNNKLKLDGTASDNGNLSYSGNAMMEWGQEGKRIYWTLIPDASGTGWTWVVGDGDYDGLLHPWNHIAYDGSINYHFYLPKYKNSYVSNGKARSMTGYQPSASATRQNERTYARANNATSNIIWDVLPYADWFFLDMMCVLFSKSLATQLKYGRGFVDYTWNDKNDAKVSGGMDTKGLFYGDSNGGISGLGVKVFGTEHPWGNGWTGITGLINASGTVKAKLCYGKADGTTVDDYNFNGSGYMPQGTIGGTSGGYIKNMNITSIGLTPKTTSGSDSTYYGDGVWFNNSQTDYVIVGGAWYNAALCGAFCCALDHAAPFADVDFGSALSCKPLGE